MQCKKKIRIQINGVNQLKFNEFSENELKKISKRMSNDFICEYISYINSRNQYNQPPHTIDELKQKVLDYAVHRNVFSGDHDDVELYDDNEFQEQKLEKVATKKKQNNGKSGAVLGSGASNEFIKVQKRELMKKTKNSDKYVAVGLKNYNHHRNQSAFDSDIIAFSSLLSLIERQPKYYSNNVMALVEAGKNRDEDIVWNDRIEERKDSERFLSKIGDIKFNVRQFFMPITDQKFKNCFYIRNMQRQVERISRIDLKDATLLRNNVLEPYTSPLLSIIDPMLFIQELKKILCIKPKLISMSVKNSLYSKNKEEVKQKENEMINFFLIRLQTLKMFGDFVKKNKIDDCLAYFNMELFQKYKSNSNQADDLKKYAENSISAFESFLKFLKYNKEETYKVFEDDELIKKIDESIKIFSSYLTKELVASRKEKMKRKTNIIIREISRIETEKKVEKNTITIITKKNKNKIKKINNAVAKEIKNKKGINK